MLTPNLIKENGFPSLESSTFSLMSAAAAFADAIARRDNFIFHVLDGNHVRAEVRSRTTIINALGSF